MTEADVELREMADKLVADIATHLSAFNDVTPEVRHKSAVRYATIAIRQYGERVRAETRSRLDAARVAIRQLRRWAGENDCWCEMSVGNPMLSRHSEACENAAAVLRDE